MAATSIIPTRSGPARPGAPPLDPAGELAGLGQHALGVADDLRRPARPAPGRDRRTRTAAPPLAARARPAPGRAPTARRPTTSAARANVGSRAAATRYSSCWTVRFGRTGSFTASTTILQFSFIDVTGSFGIAYGRHHDRRPPSPTVAPAEGKLGILCVGLGAVTTTLIAGVELAKRGEGRPVGSLTQMGTIRLGKRTDDNVPLIKDFVPLAGLDDIVFGAWDPYPDDAYDAAVRAGVLELTATSTRSPTRCARSSRCRPRSTPSTSSASRARTSWPTPRKRGMLEQLRADIRAFKEEHGCDRLVMIWSGSTEIYIEPGPAHADLDAFEAAIDAEDPVDRPVDALRLRRPAGGRAVRQRRAEPGRRHPGAAHRTPRSTTSRSRGKDFKTGQTLMKTVLAPMLKARMLGLNGWYSTNILGNRDGEVLDDPENFKTKEVSKLGVLEDVLEPERYPELYGDVYHKVRINYYPPRGDDKEGWDNIDLFGWLGYPMQMKVDFLCRDSILAAPLALDLCLFMDLAQRSGMGGIQEWLSFYFKSPQVAPGPVPRARPVHPAHEAQEHAALDDGRGRHHPPRPGLHGRGPLLGRKDPIARRRVRLPRAACDRPGHARTRGRTRPRGQPSTSRAMADELAARGHRVVVVAPSRSPELVRAVAPAHPHRRGLLAGAGAEPRRAGRRRAARRSPAPGGAARRLPIDVARTIEELLTRRRVRRRATCTSRSRPASPRRALRHSRALNVGHLPRPGRARRSPRRSRDGSWSSSSAAWTRAPRPSRHRAR